MELIDEEGHRLLAYVEAVERHGHRITVSEFDAYALGPRRRSAVPLGKTFNMRGIARALAQASEPGETALQWLDRVRWLTIHRAAPKEIDKDDAVTTTALGRAVLAAAEEGSRDEELPTQIVLDQHDPIARARVIGQIAGMGETALVDRYFSADDLLGVLHRTQIERLLVGPKPPARIAGLEQALTDVLPQRRFEVRVDSEDQFHDRFVISRAGSVWQVGTSLGGVGRRFSVMVEIKDGPAASAIRAAFEARWDRSTAIPTRELTVEGTDVVSPTVDEEKGTSPTVETSDSSV